MSLSALPNELKLEFFYRVAEISQPEVRHGKPFAIVYGDRLKLVKTLSHTNCSFRNIYFENERRIKFHLTCSILGPNYKWPLTLAYLVKVMEICWREDRWIYSTLRKRSDLKFSEEDLADVIEGVHEGKEFHDSFNVKVLTAALYARYAEPNEKSLGGPQLEDQPNLTSQVKAFYYWSIVSLWSEKLLYNEKAPQLSVNSPLRIALFKLLNIEEVPQRFFDLGPETHSRNNDACVWWREDIGLYVFRRSLATSDPPVSELLEELVTKLYREIIDKVMDFGHPGLMLSRILYRDERESDSDEKENSVDDDSEESSDDDESDSGS